jgi:hypothetical protein
MLSKNKDMLLKLAKLGYKLIHIFDKTKAYEHKALLGDKLGKL